MAEKSLLRTAAMVVLASIASLSAEAWLRAGENSEPALAEISSTDSPEELLEAGDEFGLPDDTVGAFTADLKERLEKDLKVRRPVEFAFIAKVVASVESDTLPLSLVNRCYLWARRQSTYPFQHFQNAVLKQARQIGVDL